jgi:hypothetical protein
MIFKKLLVLIFILSGLTINGYSQKKADSTLWCFSVSKFSTALTPSDISQISMSYLAHNGKKWKKRVQQYYFYGYQPALSLYPLFEISLPKKVTALEFSFYYKSEKYSYLIDEIPDTLSKYPLIFLNNFVIDSKQNQYKFKELTQIVVAKQLNNDVVVLDKYKDQPRIQTEFQSYELKSQIRIYIESPENQANESDGIILSGCGTPGSLYIIQQWINGDWVDYQNKWSLKCVPQKYKVNRYIVGLIIDRVGIFRVVFDDISNRQYSKPYLVSNPFMVK